MKQSTIFKLTFQTVMLFFVNIFELLYCYDIILENFFQSIFYTFFPLRRGENAVRQCHGHGGLGPLAGFKGLRPTAGQGPT